MCKNLHGVIDTAESDTVEELCGVRDNADFNVFCDLSKFFL